MAVLVTGVAGFIGFHTARALLARGETVLGVDCVNDYYDVRLKAARLAQLAGPAFRFVHADVSDRADRLIGRLRAQGGNTAGFTHGHFGRVLATRWIGLPVIEGQHFAISVASVGVLGFEPSHPDTMALELWNFSPSGQKWSA